MITQWHTIHNLSIHLNVHWGCIYMTKPLSLYKTGRYNTIAITNLLLLALLLVLCTHNNTDCQNKKESRDIFWYSSVIILFPARFLPSLEGARSPEIELSSFLISSCTQHCKRCVEHTTSRVPNGKCFTPQRVKWILAWQVLTELEALHSFLIDQIDHLKDITLKNIVTIMCFAHNQMQMVMQHSSFLKTTTKPKLIFRSLSIMQCNFVFLTHSMFSKGNKRTPDVSFGKRERKIHSDPAGNQTWDLLITSQMLLPLSHWTNGRGAEVKSAYNT